MTNNKANNEISYFKIGAFVLVGLGLIIFALLIFGSSKMFEREVYIETYFEESIQGVSDGSPVKYRGLQIGYVQKIAFASEVYRGREAKYKREHTRSIYVKIAITSKLFTQLSNIEVNQFLQREVEHGLRVRLVTQGLTGTSYLELDYVNPKVSPVPTLQWETNNFYVPSITSTLTRLSENAQYIMSKLKEIDFKQLFSNINNLTTSLNRVSNKTEVLLDQFGSPMTNTMLNLKIVSDNLLVMSNRIKLNPSDIVFSSYPPPLDPNKL